MPAWLAPVIMGALSAGSSWLTNRANAKQARQQMDFQERMSSTSAQRSVEDYRAAGLNPALAYERGASSPGGASAVMGDAIGAGLSSARQAHQLQQEMKQAREQHAENIRLTRTQADKAAVEGETAAALGGLHIENTRAIEQQRRFAAALQPSTVRNAAAQALLSEYNLPGAKNTADFERRMGEFRPGLVSAKSATEILKLLFPQTIRR